MGPDCWYQAASGGDLRDNQVNTRLARSPCYDGVTSLGVTMVFPWDLDYPNLDFVTAGYTVSESLSLSG